MAWKRTFIFSFLAQILSILGFSFAAPFLPFFVGELGANDPGSQAFWAGMTLSSSGLTFAIFAPVWGSMADRYGRKLMVCRAMVGGSITLLLMSYARSVPELLLCRLVQGAFSGTLPAGIALVASVVPQRRSGFALGMMQAAVFIGNTIGPFFGGMAADAFGYRMSFRLGAVLMIMGGVLVYFGTRENFKAPSPSTQGQNSFRSIILLPGFLISVLVMFGVRFSNSMANPSFPLIVRDFGINPVHLNSMTGTIMAASAVAAAFAAGILGHIGDRMGRRKVLICCCAGACIASAGHYFAASLTALFVVRILFGFTVAGMLPAANAIIHSVVDPRSIGKAYGLATSLSMLGIAAGPAIGGFLAMTTGLRTPFLFTSAAQLSLGIMVMAFFYDSKGSHKRIRENRGQLSLGIMVMAFFYDSKGSHKRIRENRGQSARKRSTIKSDLF